MQAEYKKKFPQHDSWKGSDNVPEKMVGMDLYLGIIKTVKNQKYGNTHTCHKIFDPDKRPGVEIQEIRHDGINFMGTMAG